MFRGLDLKRMARDMRQPVLVDFRNLFPIADAKASGMAYHSIGRPSVGPEGGQKADVIPFKSGTV